MEALITGVACLATPCLVLIAYVVMRAVWGAR